MVRRGEITDRAWEQIELVLPANGGKKGGRWRDHRTVVNGILWTLRTGSPWYDLPERSGPWQTCFDRFNLWRSDDTRDRRGTSGHGRRFSCQMRRLTSTTPQQKTYAC
jgi:transposase